MVVPGLHGLMGNTPLSAQHYYRFLYPLGIFLFLNLVSYRIFHIELWVFTLTLSRCLKVEIFLVSKQLPILAVYGMLQ